MPWMKIDDSFESHPKVKSIPKGKRTKAIGLWTLAGSWCARHLTDGFVPAYMVGELGGTKAESSLLVSASLWHEVDGGFTFHDWTDHQPSRAKVEEEREAAKERMRAARERKKGTRSADVRANTSERSRTDTENFANGRSVTPTRPDPTRPDPKEEEAGASSSATPRKRPATRLPDDWQPTEAHWERRHDAIDVQNEAATFRAHAEANDRRCVNWNAAFTQWLLKARPGMTRPGSQPSNVQQHLELARRLAAEEDGATIHAIGGGQ